MLDEIPLVKVQDHANLRRDPLNNAIVDVDETAFSRYLAQKRDRQQQEQRISHLEDTINKVESDISDIKNLLTRLLEK